MSFLSDSKIKNIHFVGIGGISMSGLAEICRSRGYIVSGSDMSPSETVERLKECGISIIIGHLPDNVNGKDLVVYTAAVKQDNPELVEAARLGIPTVERAPFLGELLRAYTCPIGIAGTHGKTTTTSMTAQILLDAGCDPTIMVGGILPAINSNYRIGGNEYAVFEACEYVDSFLNFYPRVAVITNIEEDHLDYFSGIDAIVSSFQKYLSNILPDGTAVVNVDDAHCIDALEGYTGNVVRVSLLDEKADYYAKITKLSPYPEFEVYQNGFRLGIIMLRVPGKHNVYNALCAIAVARLCGVSFEHIACSLLSFSGAKRRFEYIGERNGITVVDDYSHHPTEIAAALSGAKNLDFGRVVCLFQPHTYTRTSALLNDFARVLENCDKCLLLDIYAAREQNTTGITSEAISMINSKLTYVGSFDAALRFLKDYLKQGDLVMTMGAGDVYKIGHRLLKGE